MSELNATSRYNFAALYRDKDGDYFGTRQLIKLSPHPSDTFHQVTDADSKRIDLIAYKYYKDVRLWWVIADANDVLNPLELQVGSILRIPSYERVMMQVVG